MDQLPWTDHGISGRPEGLTKPGRFDKLKVSTANCIGPGARWEEVHLAPPGAVVELESLDVSARMDCIAIKIDPARLTNPDADMRYALPDLLSARSGGVIQDDGYDYIGPSNLMVVFLRVTDLERARACITDVITSVRVLENDLRQAATVAIQRGEKYETIYPAESREEFVV